MCDLTACEQPATDYVIIRLQNQSTRRIEVCAEDLNLAHELRDAGLSHVIQEGKLNTGPER